MRLRLVLLIPALAACGGGDGFTDGGPDTPVITAVEPDFGPLSGGARVLVTGSGFLRAGAPPNRVLIGGVEAPQAGAIDDQTLEVVIPAADSPGPVDVVVLNSNGFAEAAGAFRYSTPPTITNVTPGEVLYTDLEAQITIQGSGFVDEDAGPVRVLVDGLDAIDLQVESDTEITFTARPGAPLVDTEIQVINRRGEATADGFRYVPSFADGLLVFTRGTETFAVFYDPAAGSTVSIPRRDRGGGGGATSTKALRSVARDANGDVWASNRENRFGKIDFGAQDIVEAVPGATTRIVDMVASGSVIYGIDRNSRLFGSVDVGDGSLTPIGTAALSCCSRYALAVDGGGNGFVLQPNQIVPIDLDTGVLGTPVSMTPFPHVTGARFLGGTLYVVTRDSQVYSVNPATGVATLLIALPGGGASAVEVLQ